MKIQLPKPRESSLLCGETGILLVAWRLAPSAELADILLERVRANVTNEADEVMWGTPGTLIAALYARMDRRRALASGVAGERGRALVKAWKGRLLGAASPRP